MTTPEDPFAPPAPGSQPPPPPYGGPQPPPYGAPLPYGTPHGRPRNGLGLAALVLGLASIVVLPVVVPGVVAIVLGVAGRRRVRRGEADNGGVALWGIITGAVGVVVGSAIIALFVAFAVSSAGQDLIDCMDNAHNDKAAQDACVQTFVDDFFGR